MKKHMRTTMANETTADIIAEMRALSNPMSDGIIAINGRSIADRLEAALKRELSKNTSKNGADFGQLGDAAKLREALCESRRIASGLCGCRLNDYWKLDEIVRVCDAALAAPPRNCDRPECATTKAAQDVWRKEDGGKTAYYEWLLATTTEGGAK